MRADVRRAQRPDGMGQAWDGMATAWGRGVQWRWIGGARQQSALAWSGIAAVVDVAGDAVAASVEAMEAVAAVGGAAP